MQSNGRPHDPLMAAQFSVNGVYPVKIGQAFDRTDGQYLPELSGTFLRVDKVDLPCRICFGPGDFAQSVPMVPGMTYEGNFSGITLYHDNYSLWNSFAPTIGLMLGRGASIFGESVDAKTSGLLPSRTVSATLNQIVMAVPSPRGYRRIEGTIRINGGGGTAGFGTLNIIARDLAGVAMQGANVVRNGVTYSGFKLIAGTIASYAFPTFANPAGMFVSAGFDFPFPDNAESVEFSFAHSTFAGSNLTADLYAIAK